MKKFSSYKSTLTACYSQCTIQSIVAVFAPLLFVTFQNEYGVPLNKITLLIAVNFSLQLCVDFASAFFIDKIGYRACVLVADFFVSIGLIFLTVLPSRLPDPYTGLFIANAVYAIGSGLLEVSLSPVIEACPGEYKEKKMSLLHSFYSWGCVAVVGLSSLFFATAGAARWKVLTRLWAVVPAANAVFFTFVPVASLKEEGAPPFSVLSLLKNRTFWQFALIIACAGAAEVSVSQWASAFAEKGLGVSKAAGDLFGPALFALCMGVSRTLYGKFGDRINLQSAMTVCSALCTAAYLFASLSSSPVLSLFGMALCGFSVGLLWPGALSLASARIKNGGALFALLALAGDLGCVSGPSLVGCFAGLFNDNLKIGILFSAVFPLTLSLVLIFFRKKQAPRTKRLNATQSNDRQADDTPANDRQADDRR
ncbi:MAG: MFS transporter [Candidatus Borkfalkiaceae bacterium]|nr:MFS transporter [Clostridia bacterium]MDY6223053.1 MFS transporter [Christensenellaceae bacterium]